MNITWNKVLCFTAGAVIGAAVTGKYFKTKYERIAQEEIDSVKRAFSVPQQYEPVEGDTESVDISEPTPEERVNYAAIISAQGYDSEVASPIKTAREEVKGVARPYVISPADFDTEDGYEVVSLDYYADGILSDSLGNIIEDVDGLVGLDSLNHFGEYEEDSVHVRNDAQECDIEILRDLRNYSDVYHNGPRPDED